MPVVRFLLLPLAAALLAAPAFAQTPAGDAVRGKALFDNPAQASGNSGLAACASCHGSVEARRAVISQNTGGAADPYADISFDAAWARFSDALQNQQAMAAFRVLSAQQRADIAAYLADTPKTNPPSDTQLNFITANNSFSTASPVTLTHARATTENLVVTKVELVGAGRTQFVVGTAAACEGRTLRPAESCNVTVTYSPTTNAAASADLVLTMRQGTTTNPTFERALSLRGQIASAGGGSGGGSSGDSGGGALGLGWLLALGAAVLGLSRRRG